MSNDQSLLGLRTILANLYPTEADQRRLASDAGLSKISINFNDKSVNVWHNIILEAQKNPSKLSNIISTALAESPKNVELIEVEQKLRKVTVRFLIAAMTQDEATALFNETAFNDIYDPSDRLILIKDFQNFSKTLTHHSRLVALLKQAENTLVSPNSPNEQRSESQELKKIQICYRDERDAWCPSYSETVSIKQIIDETLASLNGEELRFVPEFVSTNFFSKDEKVRAQTIDELDEAGGVLVIDAISMYHPWLNKRISEAYSIHKHITVLIVSPFDVYTQPINQCVESIFRDRIRRAHERFDKHDLLCEIDLGNLRNLRRLFLRMIPETVRMRYQEIPHQTSLNSMRLNYAVKRPLGINKAFNGPRGT